MRFICYNYLPVYADYVFDLDKSIYTNIGIHPLHSYPILNINELKPNQSIFVKTDLLDAFFTQIFPHISLPFYLLTGVSDYEINNKYLQYLDNNKIIKWLGHNISICNHPKIFKLPIGFQEPDRKRNGTAPGEGGDQELLFELYSKRKHLSLKHDKLLITYMSDTNSLRNEYSSFFHDNPFVVFLPKLKFEEYLNTINDYKYVLCPPGNGIDTHRIWEVLLMGSIPIVEQNSLCDLYSRFPCIIVDSFKNMNVETFKDISFDESKYANINDYIIIKENIIKRILG